MRIDYPLLRTIRDRHATDVGDTMRADDYTFQVVDMDGRRTDKVAIRRTATSA
jgi:CBS domain containing-hemolysin-like protein